MLTFDLPEVRCSLLGTKEDEKIALAVLGGKAPDPAWLKQLPDWPVFCADRGAEYANSVGRKVDLLVGDQDSADRHIYNKVKGEGGQVVVHPSEKDFTDTQLLLREIEKEPCHLVVAGAFGGRLDHLQSNLRSLINYKKTAGRQVLLADGEETLVLLRAGESCALRFETEDLPLISFLPFEQGSRVSGTNLKWAVENFLLSLENPNAISNVLLAGECKIKCDAGMIGVYLYKESRKKDGICSNL